MATTHYVFRLLSRDVPLPVVYHDGMYLARRWKKHLYHLPADRFAAAYYHRAA